MAAITPHHVVKPPRPVTVVVRAYYPPAPAFRWPPRRDIVWRPRRPYDRDVYGI